MTVNLEQLRLTKELPIAKLLIAELETLLDKAHHPEPQSLLDQEFIYDQKKMTLEYNSWIYGWPGIRMHLNEYQGNYPRFESTIESVTLLGHQISEFFLSFEHDREKVVVKPHGVVRPQWEGRGVGTSFMVMLDRVVQLSLIQFPRFMIDRKVYIKIEDASKANHLSHYPEGFTSYLASKLGYTNHDPNGKSRYWTKRIR